MDRRDFLKRSLLTGGLVFAGARRIDARPANQHRSSSPRIVISRDHGLRTPTGSMDSDRLLAMLDRGMQASFDVDTPVEAWKRVVHPDEVVGLKINCLSGLGNSTNVELVDAICDRLEAAGIPMSNIVVWDRLNEDLEKAGFPVRYRGGGIRYMGNDVLGFDRELSTYGTAASLLCRTLTELCDCVINIPVLKDHGIAGVTVALKNMFGAIHNPNKYHLDVGDPFIADVNMLWAIRQKTRLVVCDATTAQYEGGPSFLPHWTWSYNGLIIGRDPVALDTVGWGLIEEKRAQQGMPALSEVDREPTYIATAADADHRLGSNDSSLIEVIEI
ncbi:MAG: DUF362 domain-containing protein [Candidatus Latescibacterota bacterium]|nr:MAG: DUF362 domain-containing protein [Candidatus Latescibacterota bacterium]